MTILLRPVGRRSDNGAIRSCSRQDLLRPGTCHNCSTGSDVLPARLALILSQRICRLAHLGEEVEHDPARRGFQKSYTMLMGGAGHFDDEGMLYANYTPI